MLFVLKVFQINLKQEKSYKLIPHVEQLAVHFQIDGNLIHKESEDAKRQMQFQKDHPGDI